MKKCLILVALLIGFSMLSLRAQNSSNFKKMSEKALAKQIAKDGKTLSKEFDLKDAKKDSFITIYSQYRNEMYLYQSVLQQAMSSLQLNKKSKKEESTLTDSQAEKIILATIQSKKEMNNAQIRYFVNFKKMLSSSQILEVFFYQNESDSKTDNSNTMDREDFNRGGGGPGGMGGGRRR